MIICLEVIKKTIVTAAVLSLAFILGIIVAGPNHLEASANSNNEAAESTRNQSANPAALSELVPDLVVQDITLSPENPILGDTVTFTVTIKNQGTEEAGPSRVAYYIDGTYLASEYMDPIAAGTTVTKTFTWKPQVGSHTVTAVADSSEQVTEADENNNTKAFTFSTLAPDLIIQSITWTPESSSIGDSIVFSITIKNQGSIKSGSTNVNFYIDGNSRGFQDIYSIDAGVSVTRTYTWVTGAGQHTIQAVVDEANNIKESNEANNKQSLMFSNLLPDLVILDITWSPENPSRDDNVIFTANITNQGSGRSDSCYVAYYIDGDYLASGYVTPLEAGSSVNMTFNLVVVADSYDIKVIVDHYERVIESNEGNNEKAIVFLTQAPDLLVQDITWSPTDAAAGDEVTFSVTIKNQGSAQAESSRAAYYISNEFTSYLDIEGISAGDEVTKTFDWVAVAGSHTVKVVTNVDRKFIESNYDNNRQTVTIPVSLSDLIIEDITWFPEDAIAGDTITFTVIITNQGSGVAEHFRVACFIDETLLISDYISQIKSGASANRTITWESQNGLHTFKTIADYNTSVLESDEDNNENAVIVSPVIPDLIIDNITWSPTDLSAGDELIFDVTIKNQGTNSACPFRITCYVDGSITGYRDVRQMDAGAMVTERFPWMVVAGPHIIKLAADSNNQVTESDETNNVKSLNLPPPDLIIQDISWSPTKAVFGDTVTFTVKIRNQGSGKTDGSQAALYIDDSSTGDQQVPALDSGAIAIKTFDWIAEAGTHSIKIATDPDNQVTEIDETNNEKKVSFTTLTPDLIIQDINWSMENPSISDDVTFLITIKNQGSHKADGSQITWYIDDSPSGYQDVPEISAGATITESFISSVEAGPHTVNVAADSNNQINEIDEANNEKTLSFSNLVPDLVIQDINWLPIAAFAGDNVTFTVKIKNQGSDMAANPRVEFFVDDSSVGYCDIKEIGAGATVTKDFTWIAEAGSHDVRAFADLDELILESNESNNSEHLSLSLPEIEGSADLAGKLKSTHPRNTGTMGEWWWLLFVALLITGGIAIAYAMKSARK